MPITAAESSTSLPLEAEVRLYDHLFAQADPGDDEEGADFTTDLNPHSLEVLPSCRLEPSLAGAVPGRQYQFERLGYFCVDLGASASGALVFNRTVTLRDTWAKIEKAQQAGQTRNSVRR